MINSKNRRDFLRAGAVVATIGTVGCRGDETPTDNTETDAAKESGSGVESGTITGHPMYCINPMRTGYNPEEQGPTDSIGKQWEVTTESSIYTSPIVDQGTVYIGTSDGSVYAIDAKTGDENWYERLTEKPNDGIVTPAVHDQNVILSSKNGEVYALNASDGSIRWQYEIGHRGTAPAVVDGTVFVGGGDPVHALKADTGDSLWQFETYSGWTGPPAVGDETVCIGTDRGYVQAINRVTGEEKWRFDSNKYQPTTWNADYAPVIAGDSIYINNDNFMIGLDKDIGSDQWHTGYSIISDSPALYDQTLYFIASGNQDYLIAIDTATGQEKWLFETPPFHHSSQSAPIVVDDTVYIGSESGIFAVDAISGQKVWQFDTESPVHGSPAVVDNIVYFGDRSGSIYALTTTT